MTNLDLIDQTVAPQKKRAIPSLLRPHQAKEIVGDIKSIGNRLGSEAARKQIDVSAQKKQKRTLEQSLEDQTPKAFKAEQMDDAIQLEKDLRGDIVDGGMCTQEEMRKNPHGAVDKHLGWQDRTAIKQQLWKNLRLRLGASDHEFDNGMNGASRNLANLEMYRPKGGAKELNMDNTQIEGKKFYGGAKSVVFTDHEMLIIKAELPEIYQKMALLEPDQRQMIKQQIALSEKSIADASDEDTSADVPTDFVWATKGPFSMSQGWPALCVSINNATGFRPKNKADAVRLIQENNLE